MGYSQGKHGKNVLEERNAGLVQNWFANCVQHSFQHSTFVQNYCIVLRLVCLKTAVVSVLMIWMFVTELRASAGMLKGRFQNFKGAW